MGKSTTNGEDSPKNAREPGNSREGGIHHRKERHWRKGSRKQNEPHRKKWVIHLKRTTKAPLGGGGRITEREPKRNGGREQLKKHRGKKHPVPSAYGRHERRGGETNSAGTVGEEKQWGEKGSVREK